MSARSAASPPARVLTAPSYSPKPRGSRSGRRSPAFRWRTPTMPSPCSRRDVSPAPVSWCLPAYDGGTRGRQVMSDVPEVIQRAARVFPGGVLGSHRSGPGLEFVVREGRGPYLWDTTGRRYIDYLLGSGPMLLGHAHPAVVGAVQRQLSHGTTYMLLNEPVIELAEELVRAVKCCEQVRFTSSGSEATFFALRVARAYRGRDKILKFEGGWHGTHD